MRSLRVGGLILCGGQSQRMGRAKAWLPFGAETMLARVVRILSEVVQPVIVVAAPEQDLPALPAEVGVVRDQEKGKGPLQGLASGLPALSGLADAAYVSSCDVPFLRPEFVRRMIEKLGDATICVPNVGEYYHPLAAVYRLDVLDAVRELLALDLRRPTFLFGRVTTRDVTANELEDVDPGLSSLRNLNHPEDYEAALREFTGAS